MSPNFIIILGGTFDPIHCAHLYIATQSYQRLQPNQLWLMPCGNPVHRDMSQVTSVKHRMEMLALAADTYDYIKVVNYESDLDRPAVTLDTLKRLKKLYPSTHFGYLMGQDVIEDVQNWDEWQHLIDYTHLIVVNRIMGRHSKPIEDSIPKQWLNNMTSNRQDLLSVDHGCIYGLSLPPMPIAATQIRASMRNSLTIDPGTLPRKVSDYIIQHHLYVKP